MFHKKNESNSDDFETFDFLVPYINNTFDLNMISTTMATIDEIF